MFAIADSVPVIYRNHGLKVRGGTGFYVNSTRDYSTLGCPLSPEVRESQPVCTPSTALVKDMKYESSRERERERERKGFYCTRRRQSFIIFHHTIQSQLKT